nr:proteasome subunit alpha type-5-like [Setaria viridis]
MRLQQKAKSRPFGVSLLIAGHDENGPSLYYTDPSGTFLQCNAKAIGSGSEGADSSLQEQYNKDLTLQEAETIALSILKQVMEEKVTPNNVDIAKVAPKYHLYTPLLRSKPSLQGCETLADSCYSHHQSVIDRLCTKRGHVDAGQSA